MTLRGRIRIAFVVICWVISAGSPSDQAVVSRGEYDRECVYGYVVVHQGPVFHS